METLLFIKKLKESGIDVSLNEGNLEIAFDGKELPADVLDELRRRKGELVGFLQKINEGTSSESDRIEVVGEQDGYPMSSSQVRFWLLSKLDDSSQAYNMQGSYEFNGKLNLEALKKAFHAVVQRHEIFRTAFKAMGLEDPKQYVLSLEESGFKVEVADLRGETDVLAELIRDVANRAEQPFDMASGCLFRVKIYQVEEERFFLSYMLHHIISDGWTMKLLQQEILTFYQVFDTGSENPLPPLRIQYKDYAAWQRKQLSGDNLNRFRKYWLDQFQGELPVLNLLGDRTRPVIKTFNGKVIAQKLDTQTVIQLREMSQQKGGTLFTGLVSVVKLLLFKLTNQTDLIVGTPIAGRNFSELDNQMGLYLNTLALRSRFDSAATFDVLLEIVKKTTLEAFEHQIYPFDELVDDLRLKTDLSRNPLFDVMVVLQNLEVALHTSNVTPEEKNTDKPALSAGRVSLVESRVSKFDLMFDFSEYEDSLALSLEFNTDIFDESTAERLICMFELLAKNAVAQHKEPINSLACLSDAEVATLQKEFNNTDRPLNENETVVSLFNAQVSVTPQSVALQFEDKQFTYRELDEISNQFAHFLANKGVEHQEIVGVHTERSEWTVITILAILKLGAAYLPIPTELPDERVRYMLDNGNVKVSVNDALVQQFLSEQNKFTVDLPLTVISPNDLMYVMFTSGSTGKPKGILMEHKPVVNLLDSLNTWIDTPANSTILSLTSISFDVFVAELFLPLTTGMKVILGNEEAQKSPILVKQLILDEGVTHLQMTPSRLSLILDKAPDFSGLKYLIVAGEAFPDELVQRLDKVYKGITLNAYGPSETCVYSSIARVSSEKPVHIGRPVGNTSIYILNDTMALQPIGVPGEICIAGNGLARGYVDASRKDSAGFVPNPFVAGARMYRTGDLGRWKQDGTIEYLGRKDSQVKIRGYRIEPGEIEKNLNAIQGINAAVVTAKKVAGDETALVAYITGEESFTSTTLRAQLSANLPPYMIPEYFVQLEAIPMSTSGKIDFKALPDPSGTIRSGMEYIAPENEIQEKLVVIWKEILGLDEVGILDNFFDLGGNSIRLIKLVDRICQEFDQKIGYINAFKYPSIESFSAYLSNNSKESLKVFEKDLDEGVNVMDETFNLLNTLDN